jgi:hypothetical protein
VSRLSNILTTNGYQTDAGAQVFILEDPALGEDDGPAAIAVVVGADQIQWQGNKGFVVLPVEIQAHSKSGTATPWATVEAVLADIKTAVEQDHDLAGTLNHNGLERGTTRVVKREPGSTTVGTGVEYRLQYAEAWGAP